MVEAMILSRDRVSDRICEEESERAGGGDDVPGGNKVEVGDPHTAWEQWRGQKRTGREERREKEEEQQEEEEDGGQQTRFLVEVTSGTLGRTGGREARTVRWKVQSARPKCGHPPRIQLQRGTKHCGTRATVLGGASSRQASGAPRC